MPSRLRTRKPPKSLQRLSVVDKPRNPEIKHNSLLLKLFDPIDNTALVFFRCLWGLVMMFECLLFIQNDYRKLENDYMRSEFYPKYYGFEWVESLPGLGMYYMIWIMFLAAVGITFGAFYRVSSVTFFLLKVYMCLLDVSLYSDQQYYIILVSFLMIFLPANGNVSFDSYVISRTKSNTMSRWCLLILQFQQCVVYLYFGIGRINEDWIRGEPLRHWITHLVSSRESFDVELLFPMITGIPILNSGTKYLAWLAEQFLLSEFIIYLLAWCLAIFSISASFILLLSKGNYFKVTLFTCFALHLATCWIFKLGIFPLIMMTSLTLFFKPQWIRSFFSTVFYSAPQPNEISTRIHPLQQKEKILLCLLGLFVIQQLVTPWRPLMYPGNAIWNEMGTKFTWEMGVRDKYCEIELAASDTQGEKTFRIDFDSHLYGKQPNRIMPHPDQVIQFCHFISNKYTDTAFGGIPPIIRANLLCEVNYRGKQQLLDPNVNLAQVDPHNWIYLQSILSSLSPLSSTLTRQFPWNAFLHYFVTFLWDS